MKWDEIVLLSTQSRLVFTGHVSQSPSSCNSSDFARQSFCCSIQILQACQCLGKIISPSLFHLARQTKKFPTKRDIERQCTAAPGVRHSGYGTKVSLCMYHQVASGSVPSSLITHTAVLVQAERAASCQGDGLWALISSSRYQLWYLVWMTKCWLGWFWSPFSPPRYPRRHYTPVSSVHFPSQSPFCWLFAGNSFQKHLRLWVLKQ